MVVPSKHSIEKPAFGFVDIGYAHLPTSTMLQNNDVPTDDYTPSFGDGVIDGCLCETLRRHNGIMVSQPDLYVRRQGG